jgi:hypothetical protein
MRDVNIQAETLARMRRGLTLLRAETVELVRTSTGHPAVRAAAETERAAIDEELDVLERAVSVFARVREREREEVAR